MISVIIVIVIRMQNHKCNEVENAFQIFKVSCLVRVYTTDVTRYEVRYDSELAIELWTSRKIWGGALLVRGVQPRKDFELILTVKMETIHPVGQPIDREFLAFVIIAELWRPVREPRVFFSNFCFFGKTTPYAKFSKFCFEILHGNTDWRCCVKMS